MTVQSFLDDLQKVETLAQAGLKTVEALSPDPTVDLTAGAISAVLPIAASLLSAALSAWSTANNQPVTLEAIQALFPNSTPLSQPDGTA
jgi:hypothetical protein